jgi:NUMOD4 motif/HNH endonuclease
MNLPTSHIRNKSREDLEGEIWKEIKDYEDTYKISNLGRVRNVNTGSILLACIHKGGYFRHLLSRNRTIKALYTHRLIAVAFIPNPENKPHINHINGIKTDNRIENLEWCTPSENHIHAFKTGLRVPPYSTLGKTGALCKISKPVIKMDLDGNFIERFPSAKLAAESVGKKRSEPICHCARGESKTSAGFKWAFAK